MTLGPDARCRAGGRSINLRALRAREVCADRRCQQVPVGGRSPTLSVRQLSSFGHASFIDKSSGRLEAAPHSAVAGARVFSRPTNATPCPIPGRALSCAPKALDQHPGCRHALPAHPGHASLEVGPGSPWGHGCVENSAGAYEVAPPLAGFQGTLPGGSSRDCGAASRLMPTPTRGGLQGQKRISDRLCGSIARLPSSGADDPRGYAHCGTAGAQTAIREPPHERPDEYGWLDGVRATEPSRAFHHPSPLVGDRRLVLLTLCRAFVLGVPLVWTRLPAGCSRSGHPDLVAG